MKRTSPFTAIACALLFLTSCGNGKTFLSDNAKDDGADDVYFTEKGEDFPDEGGEKEEAKAQGSERPDYYDPKVAERLEWERLKARGEYLYRIEGYGSSVYPTPSSTQKDPIDPNGRMRFKRNGTIGERDRSTGGSSEDHDGGEGSDDDGSGNERDRSYDPSDSKRKR